MCFDDRDNFDKTSSPYASQNSFKFLGLDANPSFSWTLWNSSLPTISGNSAKDSTMVIFLATKSRQIRKSDWGLKLLPSLATEQLAPVDENMHIVVEILKLKNKGKYKPLVQTRDHFFLRHPLNKVLNYFLMGKQGRSKPIDL